MPKMAKTIPNPPKPLYAVAGAADVAVAALRELPNRLPVLAERAESAAASARSRVSDLSAELPEELRRLRAELPAEVRRWQSELPGGVRKFRTELPERLHDAQTRAEHYYTELAERGETAVARFRGQPVETEAPTEHVTGVDESSRPTGPGATEERPAASKPTTAGKATAAKKSAAATNPATARKQTPRGKTAAAKKSATTKAPSASASSDDTTSDANDQPPTGTAGDQSTA